VVDGTNYIFKKKIMKTTHFITACMSLLLFASCETPDPTPPSQALVLLTQAPWNYTARGFDANLNGVLDPAEVQTNYTCVYDNPVVFTNIQVWAPDVNTICSNGESLLENGMYYNLSNNNTVFNTGFTSGNMIEHYDITELTATSFKIRRQGNGGVFIAHFTR
jgi:hypothetical protein